jgi:adenylate cyclase
MVATALRLVAELERAELPPARAGIAYGPALLRAGDFYGHAVNLASRVTGVARPGSVLATKEVRDAAADDFDWSAAGKHRFKGVSDTVALFRARPLSDAPEAGRDDGHRRSAAASGQRPKRPKADRPRRRASS